MIVKKMRQHRGAPPQNPQMRGAFKASRVAVADKPVTLPRVGGPTMEEIEAKYGPVNRFKPQGQRR